MVSSVNLITQDIIPASNGVTQQGVQATTKRDIQRDRERACSPRKPRSNVQSAPNTDIHYDHVPANKKSASRILTYGRALWLSRGCQSHVMAESMNIIG